MVAPNIGSLLNYGNWIKSEIWSTFLVAKANLRGENHSMFIGQTWVFFHNQFLFDRQML